MTRSIPTTIDLFGYICVLMKCGWRSIWIIPREDTHEDKMWGYDTLVFDDVSMNRYNLVFKLLRNHLHQLIRHLTKSPELSLRIGLYISKSSTSSLQQGCASFVVWSNHLHCKVTLLVVGEVLPLPWLRVLMLGASSFCMPSYIVWSICIMYESSVRLLS